MSCVFLYLGAGGAYFGMRILSFFGGEGGVVGGGGVAVGGWFYLFVCLFVDESTGSIGYHIH